MTNNDEFMKPRSIRKNTDRVTINVGGSRHECYISTIQNFPDTRLFWIAETALAMANINLEASEFFFDRHPGCFENILNYCRTGKLHCPKDVCGPLFEEELEFWGVDELMMQPCCWPNYSEYREVSKNLKIFQADDDFYSLEKESDQYSNGGLRRTQMKKLAKRIWNFLEPQKKFLTNVVAGVNIFVVLVSIATFCLSTEPLFRKQKKVFDSLEQFYCTFFTLDLILRILCCPSIIQLLKDFLTWFDLVSLLPFYCELIFKSDEIGFLICLRLLRIFRLLRYFKNLRGMIVIAETLKASLEQLMLLVLVLTIPMVVFATMVYYAEKNSDSKFESIPRSFWWAIITLTTVGYGDMAPTTLAGKIIGGFCATFGILMVALPISVIGSNFTFYYSYTKAKMELPKHEQKALVNADQILKGKTNGDQFRVNRKRRHALKPATYDSTLEYSSQTNFTESAKSFLLPKIPVAVKSDIYNSYGGKDFDNPFQYCKPNSKDFSEENVETSFISNNNNLSDQMEGRVKSPYAYLEKSHSYESSTESLNSVNKFDDKLIDQIMRSRSFTSLDQYNNSFSESLKNHLTYSLDVNKLHQENKRVVHLDIAQYKPMKLTKRDRADIRRKISNTNYQQSKNQINEIRLRSLSLMKEEIGKNELRVWRDDLKKNSE